MKSASVCYVNPEFTSEILDTVVFNGLEVGKHIGINSMQMLIIPLDTA